MEALQALLTKPETARMLNVSRRMVDYLVTRGLLARVKIGASVRFNVADVQAFIQSQRKAAR